MAGTAQTLTMQDIANLAYVQRPVVSMWRKRRTVRGEIVPFPDPVREVDGVEHFDRSAIVEWLQRTGRGNNAEAHLDAPSLSAPDDAELEDLVTLLCLATATGSELSDTTARQRRDLAETIDPDDDFLLREVDPATPSPAALTFVDELVEASFGAREALDRLESGRSGRAVGARDLTTDAVDLVRHVAEACSLHLDPDGVPLVHGGGDTRLTFDLAADFRHLVVTGNGPSERALRRRASIRGIATVPESTGPHVRMLSTLGATPSAALDTIDDLLLGLAPSELAVVLGPASALCDDLRGQQEQDRAQTLRSGSLAVALRLPRGLWKEAHRQPLGLWVCTGGTSRGRPLVADLGAVGDDELEPADLASDVTGALESEDARAYRYLRPHTLREVLASRLPVVPRGIRAPRLPTTDATGHLERINAATLITSEPAPTFDVLAQAAPGWMPLRRQSLGELHRTKQVKVKRGSRIDQAHADPAGALRVVSAAAGGAVFHMDPLDAARLYPNATRTEPGDIVFAERPRPTAFVDVRGGSVVASPSRVLRIPASVGIGPHTTAALINRHPDDATDWRTWNVPIVDAELVEQLELALIAAAEHEKHLREHLTATHDLVTSMIDGVAAGAVTLAVPTGE